MNIKINYGTGVATLPTAALDSLDRANKADIKLLFLLCAEPYLLFGESREACIRRIGERAGCAPAQVEASLAFWRGTGVLDMDGEEGQPIPAEPAAEKPEPAEEPVAPAPMAEPTPQPAPVTEISPAPTSERQAPDAGRVKVTRAGTKMLDEIPNYTSEDLERFLQGQTEYSTYIDECQCAWGGIFNMRDISVIISLVDTWGFSWNYVLTLLAYSAKHFKELDNQGKTLNYVYRLATQFHKEGIVTEEALQNWFVEEEHMKTFEQRIRAMFGLGGRKLTPREKKFFSTWLYEYHYDLEIVEMAYNITVDTKGTPNMNYTNGILKNWYEDGLTTREAIIAKREQEDTAVRSIKEGKLTPDNAREAVERVLNTEPGDNTVPPSGNLAQDMGILRRLLNVGNRMLTEGETAAFTKWRNEYGFRYEIIYYAYQITLENRREYSLPYMDAILSKWHAQNLNTMEAVKAYEKGFKEDKQRKKSAAPNAPAREGSFETEDFFAAAVKRSFGEDFDPSILDQ